VAWWQLPMGGPSPAVPASPAPSELSDAATEIARRAKRCVPKILSLAARMPCRSLISVPRYPDLAPDLKVNRNSTFLTPALSLSAAVLALTSSDMQTPSPRPP